MTELKEMTIVELAELLKDETDEIRILMLKDMISKKCGTAYMKKAGKHAFDKMNHDRCDYNTIK